MKIQFRTENLAFLNDFFSYPTNPKYSPEFKQGAVEQVNRPGVTCAQLARELGINANLLTR